MVESAPHAESTPPSPPSSPSGRFRLDPDSTSVHVDVKAMFGLMTVHGSFRLRSGELHIPSDITASTVSATIDAASYDSSNTKRDRDVTSKALLDAATYPDISYTGTAVRTEGDGWVVDGSVTAHGTTLPVELRVDHASVQDGIARFHATATLDRTHLGVVGKKGMVGATVKLTIDAVATPTEPGAAAS